MDGRRRRPHLRRRLPRPNVGARIEREWLPASIQGQFVRLRPIARADHPLLFFWRNDDRWPSPFAQRSDRFGRGVLSPSHRFLEFDEWQQTELQFVLHSGVALLAEQSGDGAPLGVVHMHNVSENHGWAYYREFFPHETLRRWQAAEATLLFLDHLFARYPIRKLYAEMLAYHNDPIQKLRNAGFVEEVRLEQDAWYGDSYVDYVYLGLFREDWERRRLTYAADMAILRGFQAENQERADSAAPNDEG